MAHLNIYLPDDVAASLKSDAAAAKLSLSRYVASLLTVRNGGSRWPEGYFENLGFLSEDFEEPADLPLSPVRDLD